MLNCDYKVPAMKIQIQNSRCSLKENYNLYMQIYKSTKLVVHNSERKSQTYMQ